MIRLNIKMMHVTLLAGLFSWSGVCTAAVISSLMNPAYNTSGQGDVTTTGTTYIDEEGQQILSIVNSYSWKVGQGVRIHAAGESKDIFAGSVTCPTTVSIGSDYLCEIDLGIVDGISFNEHDELKLTIESDVSTLPDELQIVLLNDWGEIKHGHLEVKNLLAGHPETQYLSIQGERWVKTGDPTQPRARGISKVKRIALKCNGERCGDYNITLSNLVLVQDLITKVKSIEKTTGTSANLILTETVGRNVTDSEVFHDDTVAVQLWLDQARSYGAATLTAPAGTYLISKRRNLFSKTHLYCENGAIFKNSGRSKNGASNMFVAEVSRSREVRGMRIENCQFDVNGWNKYDFLSVISIVGSPADEMKVEDIHIRNNRFFDSQSPGRTRCDRGRYETCETLQRQYILIKYVDGAYVEHNRLSDGGRIKVGGPGRNIHINYNTLDFVNDNGITVVDVKKLDCPKSSAKLCLTEDVNIIGNEIIDPVSGGIFFGVDGDKVDHANMTLRNINISSNTISGYFSSGAIVGFLPANSSNVQISGNTILPSRERPANSNNTIMGIALNKTELPDADVQWARCNESGRPQCLTIQDNAIYAEGDYSKLTYGILVRRKTVGLNIDNNKIIARHGGKIEEGIRFLSGIHDNVRIQHNTVHDAGIGLQIKAVFDGHIKSNHFLNSVDERKGQITIAQPNYPRGPVLALIHKNKILNSLEWNGYGIYCTDRNILVADIRGNTIKPAKTDIHNNCKL